MIATALTEEGSLESLVAQVVDDFLARQKRGEQPDPTEYAARHPHAAGVLREVLAALQVVGLSSAAGLTPGSGVPGEGGAATGTLGDFRIVREVGRGGMGVVYEAEQISLGRRVALKVLPFAATMDPRQLQRFLNEARAAASLHHEHIVPVYAVGQERGVHHYAMQFIDGKSLAELMVAQDTVGRERQPSVDGAEAAASTASPVPDTQAVAAAATHTAPRDAAYFRRVAEWGIQAAEALEHAHALGIVHRDIKPGNLLIDGHGKLWVTDFGLARTAADGGLTMTGDVLGTLRYMSPEQALARHGLVDHRTDVYSLGASLYELLTGRPAVAGQDRQLILKRIAEEEPPPLRALDRGVPADLETIVLKALAREPGDRYASAQEMADDLRCFLEARPIRAKRPTLPQRLRKWGQRHRHLVGAAALFLALVVVGLAVSVFLIWREKEQTRAALAEARTNNARAEAQRRRAETNFRQAYWTIEALLCVFDPARSSRPVSVTELRQWQTERALRFLAPFCEDPSEDPAVRLQKGAAYVHRGRVYQVLGDREKTRKAFHQAVAVFDRLVQDFPDDSQYPLELGSALHILAEDFYQAGDVQEANAYFSRAIGIFRDASRNHPAHGEIAYALAKSLSLWFEPELRDPTIALGAARKAVEIAPHDPDSWIVLGVAYYRTGQWDVAVRAIQEAARREGGRGKLDPTIASCFLAMAQWRCGRQAEAMEAYQQAVRNMENSFAGRDIWDRAIRTEAATLLGVQESATPRVKEEDPCKDQDRPRPTPP
jgi:serine/threonine protein kinase